MNHKTIEQIWNIFLSEIENKEAWNDLRYNKEMPLQEREHAFKHYLSLWAKLNHLEKGTSSELFDYALLELNS